MPLRKCTTLFSRRCYASIGSAVRSLTEDYVQNFVSICHFGNVLRFPPALLSHLRLRRAASYRGFSSGRSLRTFPTFYFLHTIMDVTDCIYDCKQKTDFDMIKKKINVFVLKAIKSIGKRGKRWVRNIIWGGAHYRL